MFFCIITWSPTSENVPCAHRRLKSACAFAQSDHSLRCSLEDFLNPCLSKMRPVKILIRLRECAGWSESSPGAYVRRCCFLTLWVTWMDVLFLKWLDRTDDFKEVCLFLNEPTSWMIVPYYFKGIEHTWYFPPFLQGRQLLWLADHFRAYQSLSEKWSTRKGKN